MAFEGISNESGETTQAAPEEEKREQQSEQDSGSLPDPNDGQGLESRGGTSGGSGGSSSGSETGGSGVGSDSSSGESEADNEAVREFVDSNYTAGNLAGAPPRQASSLQSRSGSDATVVFNQGLESGEGSVAEQARDFEEQILSENPGLQASEVTIGVDTGSARFTASVDEQAARQLSEDRAVAAVEAADRAGFIEPDSAFTFGDLAVQEADEAGIIQPDAARTGTVDYSRLGGDATTAADFELQQAEAEERARSAVVEQLEEEGIDLDRVEIETDATSDGVEVSVNTKDRFDIDWSFGLGGEGDEVEAAFEDFGEAGEDFIGQYTIGFEEAAKERLSETRTSSVQGADSRLGAAATLEAANAIKSLPQLPATVLEGLELGYEIQGQAYAAEYGTPEEQQEALEELEGLAGEAVDLGQSGLDFAVENPTRAYAGAGLAAGGELAAGAALRRAGRISTPNVRVREFVTDTRGQGNIGKLGTEQIQIQKQKFVDDVEEPSRELTMDDLEAEGVVEVWNRGPNADPELPALEQEARDALPAESEYPTQAQYLDEVEQMMRRFEKRDLESEAAQDLNVDDDMIEAPSAGSGLATATVANTFDDPSAGQLEGTEFLDGSSQGDAFAIGDDFQQSAKDIEESFQLDQQRSLEMFGDVQTAQDSRSMMAGPTVDTKTDLFRDLQRDPMMDSGTPQLDITDTPNPNRRPDLDLGGLEADDFSPLGFDFGGSEKRYEFETRDLL